MNENKNSEIPYFDDFKERYAPSSQLRVYYKIREFAFHCKKKLHKTILEVTSKEILSFFNNIINKKNIKKTTKLTYYYFLNTYYDYVEAYKKEIEDNNTFKNPMPSTKILFLSGTTQTSYDLEMSYQPLTLKIIERILHHIYYTIESKDIPEKIFIAISLLIYSGARIREVCTQELKKIDLKKRWFKNKVKSRMSEREGYYFFPEFFVPELTKYIKKLKQYYPNAKYLFQKGMSHITPRILQTHLRNTRKALGLTCHNNPHAFRDFLNTKRADKGLTTPQLEFLLNQTVKGVNPSSYMKEYKNRTKLRSVYDSFNPFEKLLKPHPKL